MDADMAKAARTVIVSAEQIVSPEEIAATPDPTMLPHFAVDAVVAAPHGSYPHECYGRYGPDFEHFTAYAEPRQGRRRRGVAAYCEENVDGPALRRVHRGGRAGAAGRAGGGRGELIGR